MRYLLESLNSFAKEKFALLTGPRQVGKTTLANYWLARTGGVYLNWDDPEDRETLLRRAYLKEPLPPPWFWMNFTSIRVGRTISKDYMIGKANACRWWSLEAPV